MGKSAMRMGVLGFEGANAMDIVGPLEAFASASALEREEHPRRTGYETLLIGLEDKPFTAESGVLFKPHCHCSEAPPLDTLIIPGGPGLREPRTNAAAATWIAARAPRTRRVASVCTGIFGLAATGLLDGVSLPLQSDVLLRGTLERVCRALAKVAEDGSDELVRQAGSALYHITTAIFMAVEGMRLAPDHRRLAFAHLALRHKLLPVDPLALPTNDDASLFDALVKQREVPLALAMQALPTGAAQ